MPDATTNTTSIATPLARFTTDEIQTAIAVAIAVGQIQGPLIADDLNDELIDPLLLELCFRERRAEQPVMALAE